jgi:hypothetical protein
MTLHPQPLLPVPAATVAAVQAAFPKGNLYVDLRAESGTLYDDQLLANLYPPSGVPWRPRPGAWHWLWSCSISKEFIPIRLQILTGPGKSGIRV